MSDGDDSAPLIGVVLDRRYRLDAVLGVGGMGEVYRARHLHLDQDVAVKVLRAKLASDDVAVRRFMREAKSTFRFDHPHCVRVSDFGADDGHLYLVMDYLDGRTVARELAIDGPMDARRVAHILAQTADALAYAHGLGLVHRDLKAENLMLLHRSGDPDFVKVLDFGLAKMWDPEGGGLSRIMSLASLTHAGLTFGTPAYMSPEQALGQDLTPASDLYTLGVCGYEMLTGVLPFMELNPVEILSKIVRETPPPLVARRPDLSIDPRVVEIIEACMHKDAAMRPGSAAELAARLRAIESGVPGTASRSAPLPAVLVSSATLELPSPAVAPSPGRDVGSLDTRGAIAAGIRRPRWPLAVIAAAALVGVAAIWWGQAGGASAKGASLAPSVADAAPLTRAMESRADASPPAPPPTTMADAGPRGVPKDPGPRQRADGGARRPTQTDTAPALSDAQLRAQALVAEAKSAASPLVRMSKADQALRLDPRNLEAHYLFGDELVKSGNLDKGCVHLWKARRLSQARARHRSVGCASGDN